MMKHLESCRGLSAARPGEPLGANPGARGYPRARRRRVVAFGVSALMLPWIWVPRGAWANTAAGSIARVSGAASVKPKAGAAREAKVKDLVQVDDTVVTEADGQVLIRLNDKSSLLVRPRSTVVIEAFQFDNKPDDQSSTTVAAGAIRAVSGQIARDKPANVKYSAGTATIGIRGTDIEVAIIGDGVQDRAGIYNYVYAGSTEMRLDSGEVAVVEKELTGFTPAVLQPGEARLQILRDRPAFLQSSGFDALMQQLTNPRIPMIR